MDSYLYLPDSLVAIKVRFKLSSIAPDEVEYLSYYYLLVRATFKGWTSSFIFLSEFVQKQKPTKEPKKLTSKMEPREGLEPSLTPNRTLRSF